MELDSELADILSVPWEREGAMLDTLRKAGADETVQKATVGALRLLKGIEGELPEELRAVVETLGAEPVAKEATVDTDADGKPEVDDNDVDKRDVSAEERDDLADEGKALPDGSFPIENTSDLKNAIHDFGRAGDKGRAKSWITRRAKALGATNLLPDSWSLSKEEPADEPDADDVKKEEEGTVGEEATVAVPVQKEDGTWDLSGVPESSRPFYTAILKSNDTLATENVALRERVEKQEDTLRTREFVAKAGDEFAYLAPADELGSVLKQANAKLDEETYGKLETILKAANERVEKGDLFEELGRSSGVEDGSSTDAYTTAEKLAKELVEKDSGSLNQDAALAQVFERDPALYSQYLVESAGGVA